MIYTVRLRPALGDSGLVFSGSVVVATAAAVVAAMAMQILIVHQQSCWTEQLCPEHSMEMAKIALCTGTAACYDGFLNECDLLCQDTTIRICYALRVCLWL